ncbi:hypothetical protein [Nocardia jinanensis]|nr:hypothetical protein [Nocardia jinanensis]
MNSKPVTVRSDTAATAAGANLPVVRWPEPSPLADWWDEIMRHHPTATA